MPISIESIKSFLWGKQSPGFVVPKQNRLMRKLNAEELLTPHADKMEEIREMVGLTPEHFEHYYKQPIARYAELIQLSPASELHHHAHPGGMIEHNLDVVINALRIRRGQILPPGIVAEEIERKKDIWTYAVFSAALLHDVGKPMVDFYLMDSKGRTWNLMSTHEIPDPYEVHYHKDREHKLHERVPLLAMHKIMNARAIEWLASDQLVFKNLMYFLSGDYSNTPILSEIVQKADQLSVALQLGSDLNQVAATTQNRPLHERFLHTIQLLLSEDALPLNRKGAAVYTCTKSNRVYFVSKRLLDAVKDRMRKDGQSVPGRNDRLMDELQQFKVLISNEDKAIWRCNVTIDDWEQNLSMLCFDMSKIWTNLNDRPETPENQTIEPVDSNNEPLVSATESESFPSKEKKIGTVKPSSKVPEKVYEPEPEPEKNPFPDSTKDIDIPEAISELDALLTETSSEAVNDFAGFDDFADDSEPEDFEEVLEKEDPKKERAKILKEITDKAAKGRSNTVAYHNDKVAKQSDIKIEFDNPECPAALFIKWLAKGVSSATIPVNNPANQVHFVPEGLFIVSPAIFKTFERESKISWKIVQRDLTRKKINLKNQRGENIFQFEISSKSGRNSPKLIKGMLIPDPQKIGLKSSQYNDYLRIINE